MGFWRVTLENNYHPALEYKRAMMLQHWKTQAQKKKTNP
jgi:hypothetical protein